MIPRVLLAALAREEELDAALQRAGALVRRAGGRARLRNALQVGEYDLVLLDRSLLAGRPAQSVARIRAHAGHPEVVVLSDAEDAASGAALIAAGCLAVLDRRLSPDLVDEMLRALLARRRAEWERQQRARATALTGSLDDFATRSPAMLALVRTTRRVVDTDTTLLVLGETGVGKEWLARAVHAEGPRAKGPFVAVNCGALPENLMESELFGHTRGAFTGAVASRRGQFELAHGGTLFLDEVGEMPLALQVKLLRVLEEKAVRPVGGEASIRLDVRIIAATNRDPSAEIASGRLRSDLYYRLGVITLSVPPLRERVEDIPVLAASHLERFRVRFSRAAERFSPTALAAMQAYSWPGNVRELVNVVERAVLLSTGAEIGADDLPLDLARATPPRSATPVARSAADSSGAGRALPPWRAARRQAVAVFEEAYLRELMAISGGRVGEAALRAGLSPRALHDLLAAHGLRKEDFKFAAAGGD